MFSVRTTKGNNFCHFLYASLYNTALSKWSISKRKEFAPSGASLFPLTPTKMEDINQNGRNASIDSVTIYLGSMKTIHFCIPDKDIHVLPGPTILISPMLSHPGRDKNHVYLMHWLYRKSRIYVVK